VITVATRASDYQSEAWIFDARRVTGGPIARVRIPARATAGFHASWFAGRDLWGNGPVPV
jgi:carotenoid cleavage dioxygenase